ncbi:MAG: hypothetical protein M3460_10355 [Actinomycetota bacterium]|nr:hypothetical protein [Actinomycetota bacterium]
MLRRHPTPGRFAGLHTVVLDLLELECRYAVARDDFPKVNNDDDADTADRLATPIRD